jgi:hypothetical protein
MMITLIRWLSHFASAIDDFLRHFFISAITITPPPLFPIRHFFATPIDGFSFSPFQLLMSRHFRRFRFSLLIR